MSNEIHTNMLFTAPDASNVRIDPASDLDVAKGHRFAVMDGNTLVWLATDMDEAIRRAESYIENGV